ncbi:MAG: hypothetical protein MUO26_16215 [Methanotrichaceae archaeon]|nr:hypothetical protein [Methanotrichaceae archaeon]
MNPRILVAGEKITGKYSNITLGKSKKFFSLKLGDDEVFLPKHVGDSVLKGHIKGHDEFTIYRTKDVYEIKSVMKANG